MVRKAYTPEQLINKLREVEVLLSQGASLAGSMKGLVSTIDIRPHDCLCVNQLDAEGQYFSLLPSPLPFLV